MSGLSPLPMRPLCVLRLMLQGEPAMLPMLPLSSPPSLLSLLSPQRYLSKRWTAMQTHETATQGLARSPMRANFHAVPSIPCLYESSLEDSIIVPGGLDGSCTQLAVWARR